MNAIWKWLTQRKHMLVGASLIRISFGLIILFFYLIHYAQRRFLWGPNGMQDYESFKELLLTTHNFSLYMFSGSIVYFEIVFHLGILIAILYTVGFLGRITGILNFVFLWSLHPANVYILDGGDNIMRLLLVYLLFANVTAYFSIDRALKKEKGDEKRASSGLLSNAFHNLAILACIVQVSMMYLTSGLHKVMGEVWQNGTAVYYILQVREYTHPLFKELILSSDFLILLGSYGAVFAQISFPFLLFNRYTKYMAMTNVILMHTGIAVVMGLYTFSATMIAIQFLMLTDREYRRVRDAFQQRADVVRAFAKSRLAWPNPFAKKEKTHRPV